jgi:hypothetical protein
LLASTAGVDVHAVTVTFLEGGWVLVTTIAVITGGPVVLSPERTHVCMHYVCTQEGKEAGRRG